MSEETCESCGQPADVRLKSDGSTWCYSCDLAARHLDYDYEESEIIS